MDNDLGGRGEKDNDLVGRERVVIGNQPRAASLTTSNYIGLDKLC